MPVVDRPGPAGSSNWDRGVETDVLGVVAVVMVTLMALMVTQSGELEHLAMVSNASVRRRNNSK